MKINMKTLCLAACFVVVGSVTGQPLIPKPVSATWSKGTFSLTPQTKIIAQSKESVSDAEVFNGLLERTVGFTLQVSSAKTPRNAIVLSNDPSLSREEYNLRITKDHITVTGNGPGVLYGLLTLLQLMPVDARGQFNIPCGEITDSRFER